MEGRCRLDDPDDLVRVEVETALVRNVLVIPVLVEGAAMPTKGELPRSLDSLARRQAHLLRHETGRADVDVLIGIVERVLVDNREQVLVDDRLRMWPLHFIWIIDCSSSMAQDGKIQALNSAIREWVPHIRDVADQNPHAQVLVRVLAFSSLARWWTPGPVPIEQFRLDPLVAGGATDVGRALELVADELHIPPMPSTALPPVLVLVTDGAATDDFRRGLDRLLAEPWGRQAVRLGIAIGADADLEMLQQFIDNPELAPLEARNADQLVRYIRWAEVKIDEASIETVW